MATDVLQPGLERSRKTKRAKAKLRKSQEDLLSGDDLKTQTKATFDELMKQAMNSAAKEPGGKSKKKKKVDEQVLESLRKGEGLVKDKDNLADANTFDPDDVKSHKSNKRRQKDKETGGKDNLAFDKDGEKDEIVPRKGKKKTPRGETEDNLKTMTVNELDVHSPRTAKQKTKKKKPEAAEPDVIETEEPSAEVKKTKKSKSAKEEPEAPAKTETVKKKKKDPVIEEYEEQIKSRDLQSDADPLSGTETAEVSRGVNEEEAAATAEAKKKKKKKKRAGETEDKLSPRAIEDDGRVIGLTVHRTDKLRTDFWMAHPLVRVTVVDLETGKYLKKQHKERAVSSYFETQNANVDYILPVMTQPFDFKRNKSTLPLWEELVLLNENFNYICQTRPNTIIFFELLDFVTMNAASQKYAARKQEGGWHHIAWAFLKVVGANGAKNTDRKVRLQLYQPTPHRSRPGDIEVYKWYKSGLRDPYPSTLYVTVKGIVPPDEVEPAARSMFPTQKEKGKHDMGEADFTMDKSGPLSARSARERETARAKEPSLWSRLPGQACRVPNLHHAVLPVGRKGASIVKFSNDGKLLACASHDKDGYPLYIYEIPSMALRGTIQAHFSLIYDLDWARGDRHVITASADGTARIWDAVKMSNTAVKTLPHPSFIYTAKFHPRVPKIIATGGYDRVVRLWTAEGDSQNAKLLQELVGHSSYVNSLTFDDEGSRLFSADSVGQIRVWGVLAADKGLDREASEIKVINEAELKDVCINCVRMHVNGRRLLLHCRDNHLRMLDLRVNAVMQRYVGALNFRENLRSAITPCGSFVFAGSEDGCAYVWNTETGDQLASYGELGFAGSVCGVDFHPHDHLVAFCSLSDNSPVLIYKFDKQVAQKEAGFELQVSNLDQKSKDEILETSRKVRTLQEDFQTSEVSRYERVQRKLESVTMSGLTGATPREPRSTARRAGSPTSTAPLTWGTTFDTFQSTGTQDRAKSPGPSVFSPHAARGGLSAPSPQEMQFRSQAEYMRHSGGWRPQFNELGRSGSLRSQQPYSRPPQLSLGNMQGKPQFSYSGKAAKDNDWVVALYDYQAQRSDELSLVKDDVIKVLYRDSDNWWMGELEDGQQGYFPTNYVTGYDLERREAVELLDQYRTTLDDDDEVDAHAQETVPTAVRTKTGELKFFSAAEDSDIDSPHRKKKGNASVRLETEMQDLGSTSRSRRRHAKHDESVA